MLIESEREEAARIHNRVKAELSRIDANRALTNRARQQQKARAIVKARAALSELRAKSDARQAEAAAKAYREAFGIRPDRAGEDRAYRQQLAREQPSPAAALRMLKEAIARGDSLAQTALTELAWNNRHTGSGRSWILLLNEFADANPRDKYKIDNMVIFSNPDSKQRFTDNLLTHVTAPSDLPGNLEALAAQADEAEAGAA